MLEFDRIDLSKRIHVAKCNNSKKCIICHYWYFIGGFKFQKLVCYGCHDFLMLRLRISDITIITDKDIISFFLISGDIWWLWIYIKWILQKSSLQVSQEFNECKKFRNKKYFNRWEKL